MPNFAGIHYQLILSDTAIFVARIGIPDSPSIPWLRILGALLFCLLVAVGAIFVIKAHQARGLPIQLFRKLGNVSSLREIEIVETRRASENGQLCLFRYGGNDYLVIITAGGSTLIEKQPSPEPIGEDA